MLEVADEITGPWLPIRNAGSPYSIQFAGAKQFFRLAAPVGNADCGEIVFSPSVWNIDVPSVRIQGRFLLNGRPFPSSFLHGANFFLRRASTGDEVYLGLSNNETFDRRVVPGIYDVIYEHKIGDEVPLNSVAVVIAGAMEFDINIPTANFAADVQFNGGNLPGPIAGESARLFLEDTVTGGLIPLTFSYPAFDQVSRLVVRGTYRVRYEYESGTTLPRNTFATLGSSLSVTQKNVQTVINVRAVALSGDFLLNGGAFPGGQNAALTLRSLVPGNSLYLGGTQNGAYSTVIVPGHYAAFYNWAVGDSIPRNQNARLICPR